MDLRKNEDARAAGAANSETDNSRQNQSNQRSTVDNRFLSGKAAQSSKSAVVAARRGQEERRKLALGRLRRGEASAAAMARAESDACRVAQLVRRDSEREAKEEAPCEADDKSQSRAGDAAWGEVVAKPRPDAEGNVRRDKAVATVAIEAGDASRDGINNAADGDDNSDYSGEDDNDSILGGAGGDIDNFLKKPSYSSAPGTLQRLSNAIQGPAMEQGFSAGIRRVSAFFSDSDAADAVTSVPAAAFRCRAACCRWHEQAGDC